MFDRTTGLLFKFACLSDMKSTISFYYEYPTGTCKCLFNLGVLLLFNSTSILEVNSFKCFVMFIDKNNIRIVNE